MSSYYNVKVIIRILTLHLGALNIDIYTLLKKIFKSDQFWCLNNNKETTVNETSASLNYAWKMCDPALVLNVMKV